MTREPRCICRYVGPDEFGNYDLIEDDRCPRHGAAPQWRPVDQASDEVARHRHRQLDELLEDRLSDEAA